MGEAGQNRRNSDDVRKASIADPHRKQHPFPASGGGSAAMVHRSEISEAEIDRTLADSFPASDPPFWNSGIDRE